MIVITKKEKGTYLLPIEILSGPNKVYLYQSLTMRNFTSPKKLHLPYIPRLRVFSIYMASSIEISEFLLPVFSSSFYLCSFLATNCSFHVALNTHESNYIYFILKQKFSYENFGATPLIFKNSELKMWKNFPNQKFKRGIFLKDIHYCYFIIKKK